MTPSSPYAFLCKDVPPPEGFTAMAESRSVEGGANKGAEKRVAWPEATAQFRSIEEQARRKAEALEIERLAEEEGGSRRGHLRELASQPELWGICMGFFVLGCLDVFGKLPVNFFLKDELMWSPGQMEFWHGITSLPWVGKPLYGIFSDAVPIFGSRRRAYLIIFGLGGSAAWVSMAFAVSTTAQAIAALVLQAWTTAVILVVLDAVLVERSHGRPHAFVAFLQSFCWGAQAAGKIAGAGLTGIFLSRLGTHWTFLLVAALPLLAAAASALIREIPATALAAGAAPSKGGDGGLEEPAAAPPGLGALLRDRARILARNLVKPAIYLPCVFLLVWQATPQIQAALFYFGTNVLHFDEAFYSLVFLLEGCAQLLAVLAYSLLLYRLGLRSGIFYSGLAGVGVVAAQVLLVTRANQGLHISDRAFALASGCLQAFLHRTTMLPIAVLVCRVCPKGIEATLFGLFMSLRVVSWAAGQLLGSAFMGLLGVTSTDFVQLPTLVFVAAVTGLAPLPLVWLLPSTRQLDRKAAAERVLEREPLQGPHGGTQRGGVDRGTWHEITV